MPVDTPVTTTSLAFAMSSPSIPKMVTEHLHSVHCTSYSSSGQDVHCPHAFPFQNRPKCRTLSRLGGVVARRHPRFVPSEYCGDSRRCAERPLSLLLGPGSA